MTHHRIIIGDSREMPEVADASVHLVVTSPPYWQLKDYGAEGQIGFDDAYREYIANLNLVWEECRRVLCPGCRLCINVGDQFARAAHYGRYKVVPIRAEIIRFCERLGLDYMGAIIWQKVTTCNTSGGATIMGSFPYPRNGVIKIDYEFILVFRKPGRTPPPSPEAKEGARLSAEEWNRFFYGHWNFPGERRSDHLAAFPVELPSRLIRMFTFPGETVLDPFVGSGTTSVAALRLGRNSVGYEINPDFRSLIEQRLREADDLLSGAEGASVEVLVRRGDGGDFSERIRRWDEEGWWDKRPEIERRVDPRSRPFGSRVSSARTESGGKLVRVAEVLGPDRLKLDDGRAIVLLGVAPMGPDGSEADLRAREHLRRMVGRARIVLTADESVRDGEAFYVHLANRKFVNGRMIRDGFALADRGRDYRHRGRFESYEEEARRARRGLWAEV